MIAHKVLVTKAPFSKTTAIFSCGYFSECRVVFKRVAMLMICHGQENIDFTASHLFPQPSKKSSKTSLPSCHFSVQFNTLQIDSCAESYNLSLKGVFTGKEICPHCNPFDILSHKLYVMRTLMNGIEPQHVFDFWRWGLYHRKWRQLGVILFGLKPDYQVLEISGLFFNICMP